RRLHPLAPDGGPGRHRPDPAPRGGDHRLRGDAPLLDAEDPPRPHRRLRTSAASARRSLRYGEPVRDGRPRTSHRRGKDTMSSTFHVRGGRPLDGEITVRGAKNLVSKAMVAALLGEAPSVL